MVDNTIDERLFPITTGNIEYSISDPYLELKPLSSIGEEDLEDVTRLIGFDISQDGLKLTKNFLAVLHKHYDDLSYFQIITTKPTLKVLQVTDYLRSKGYAISFMGVSVDQLIKYGWVKLKQ